MLAASVGAALSPGVPVARKATAVAQDAIAPVPADRLDAIRSAITSAMEQDGTPGAAVYLSLPGYEPFAEAFGIADKSTGEPVTVDMHFRIGSITKTFVATVVLQMVDEGLLSLDDTIDGWDVQVPNAGDITIGHLLGMTSGLRNYTETAEFAAAMAADPTLRIEPEALIAMATGEPLSEPGESFHYNNTNYIILGLIAEQVSGQPLESLLRERVFDAVGMANTGFDADASLPEPFARGYVDTEPAPPGAEQNTAATPVATPVAPATVPENHPLDADGHYDATDFDPSWAWAAGGAWSTAGDLALWAPALVEGAMLSPDLAASRMEWMPADPARPDAGGYGLGIATQGGLVGHTGAVPGYSSLAGVGPDVALTIVVLTNLYRNPGLGMTPDMRIALAAIGAGLPLLWS